MNHNSLIASLAEKSAESRSVKILEHKAYFIFTLMFCLFYFLNVFIGMFMINNEYTDSLTNFELRETNYTLTERTYDVIEVVLLGIMVIENVVKMAFTTRQTKKVWKLH